MLTNIPQLIYVIFVVLCLSYIYFGNWIGFQLLNELFVASVIGYAAVLAFEASVRTGWTPLVNGTWHFAIPLILGFLYFSIISRKWSWMSRYPSIIIVGVGAALSMVGSFAGDIAGQISGTWFLVYPLNTFDSWVLLLGMLLALWFFIYTVPHKGRGMTPVIMDKLADLGKAFVYCFMANKYAATVMLTYIGIITNLIAIIWIWLGIGAGSIPI